jgi:hypothetical protein
MVWVLDGENNKIQTIKQKTINGRLGLGKLKP